MGGTLEPATSSLSTWCSVRVSIGRGLVAAAVSGVITAILSATLWRFAYAETPGGRLAAWLHDHAQPAPTYRPKLAISLGVHSRTLAHAVVITLAARCGDADAAQPRASRLRLASIVEPQQVGRGTCRAPPRPPWLAQVADPFRERSFRLLALIRSLSALCGRDPSQS